MSHRFTVSLEENEYGDIVITLPVELTDELLWNVGDE